jgi:hypothetical protein
MSPQGIAGVTCTDYSKSSPVRSPAPEKFFVYSTFDTYMRDRVLSSDNVILGETRSMYWIRSEVARNRESEQEVDIGNTIDSTQTP